MLIKSMLISRLECAAVLTLKKHTLVEASKYGNKNYLRDCKLKKGDLIRAFKGA